MPTATFTTTRGAGGARQVRRTHTSWASTTEFVPHGTSTGFSNGIFSFSRTICAQTVPVLTLLFARASSLSYPQAPGITLSGLFDASENVADRDAVYWMIALGELHVDLAVAALVEPERIRVFPYKPAVCASGPVPTKPQVKHQSGVLSFSPGDTLEWDGKAWRIANVGNNLISLVGEQKSFVELPLDRFETLIVEGRLKTVSSRVPPLPWMPKP